MNRIRYLAAGLLCLAGLIHVTRLGLADAPAFIVLGFGVAYLMIGGLLFRNLKAAYYLGAIVPLIGVCVGPLMLTNPPTLFAVFLGAIEIAVVVSCFWLVKSSRSANKAPGSG